MFNFESIEVARSAPQDNQGERDVAKESSPEVAQEPSQVIEDLVVSRKVDLEDVEYLDDGSVSLLSPTDFKAFKALSSGPGAAINFDISFAHNSVTMTANGNRTVEMIASAINFLGAEVSVELVVLKTDESHSSGRSALSERRAEEVVALLKQRHQLKNEIKLSYSDSFRRLDIRTSRAEPQLLPVTLVNNGKL